MSEARPIRMVYPVEAALERGINDLRVHTEHVCNTMFPRHSDVSARERFCALLYNTPPRRGDAIVVLCGEDADPRTAVALELWKQGAAPLIVTSGGKHQLPRWTDASAVRTQLLGHGVAPDRLLVESTSTNTREQAVAVISMAIEKQWTRLLLAVSPYHAPRAFLTFLKALEEAKATETLHLIPSTASQAAWTKAPAGMTETRLDLLAIELAKIDQYGAHVASIADGIDYLTAWEAR